MNKFFSVPLLLQSALALIRRHFRGALIVFLIIGFSYGTLFLGVSKSDGLWNKQEGSETPTEAPTEVPTEVPTEAPTEIPTETLTEIPTEVPTEAPTEVPTVTLTDIPTYTLTQVNTPTYTLIPTNTPTSTNTSTWTPTSTRTSTLTPTSTTTPTVTPTPTQTRTPTSTPTRTPTATEVPTDTVPPGAPTSTPRPSRTPPEYGRSATPTPLPSVTAAVLGPAPSSTQTKIVPSATASLTPTSIAAIFPLAGISAEPNPKLNANGMPYLLLLAALVIGGGAFFILRLQGHTAPYDPSLGGGGSAAPLIVNPATVGAFGFSGWLAGQATLLSDSEKVVLSKVADGIRSALKLAGGSPDLKLISEIGTQESLQLTARSPFLTSATRGTGLPEER